MADDSGGRLTTHVLDTASGRPACGIRIELFRIGDEGGARSVAEAVTNEDGRCDGPILSGDGFAAGIYELRFAAGAYLDRLHGDLPEPRFLDEIVIRFGVSAAVHYHVPLLLSPFGYSTYRGS